MNVKPAYVSSIPPAAEERVVKRFRSDGTKRRAEYYVKGKRVGLREYYPTGALDYEHAFQNGVRHGMQYQWHSSGKLHSAEPYENGVPHGTAYQWAEDGSLTGSYTLNHGTGIDLWWLHWTDKPATLSEVHYMQDGLSHGFEWWLDFDQQNVRIERHWFHGVEHGIERKWNWEGRLRRGFPCYHVQGEQVTKAKYLRAAAKDATLPPFRVEDNSPQRIFPPEIARHLTTDKKKSS